MRKIEGLEDSFKDSKIIYLVTFGPDGEKHSRPMTNFNDTPYHTIWFPTYKETRKVKDIKSNDEVLLIFPHKEKEKFFKIKGKAGFEDQEVTQEKWRWWYLYWHPEMSDKFWFEKRGEHEERMIINVEPLEATIISKEQVEYISKPYKSIIPEKRL